MRQVVGASPGVSFEVEESLVLALQGAQQRQQRDVVVHVREIAGVVGVSILHPLAATSPRVRELRRVCLWREPWWLCPSSRSRSLLLWRWSAAPCDHRGRLCVRRPCPSQSRAPWLAAPLRARISSRPRAPPRVGRLRRGRALHACPGAQLVRRASVLVYSALLSGV